MRSILSAAFALSLAGLLPGCATSGAYGPDADTRLEMATTEQASAEGSEAAQISCSDIPSTLRSADEKPEGERLELITATFSDVKSRTNQLENAISRNPDLVFTETGDQVRANLEGCRSALADATSNLDRSIRDIVELPIIQEVHGNRTVAVPRMDFAIVRNALEVLGPEDKDTLLGRLEYAEKKVAAANEADSGNTGNTGRRRR